MATYIKAVEFTGGDDFAGTRFHKYCVRNQEVKTGLYIGPYKEVEIEGGDICAYCGMPIMGDAPEEYDEFDPAQQLPGESSLDSWLA